MIAAGTLWFLNYRLDASVATAKEEATQAQNELTALENTAQYQKISFAQELYQEAKDLPWSEHITALIEVLQSVQNINSTNGTIELYDFTVNLDSIEISGRTSSLALLYYPKSDTREGLISAVSELPFLDDIRIQTYLKADDMYEFTLYATIILDEATQQQ
ncbi:MAG: hypothetical protein H6766_02935 [Candidatus Peribacteria bacterium]|nr:MAG: hypothetical protein H6766_02935 [Candidatus Peribacteria bacterium]